MFQAMLALKNLENQKFTVTLEGKERWLKRHNQNSIIKQKIAGITASQIM